MASGSEEPDRVDQGGELDGVPRGDGEPLEQVASYGPLPRQRLHQPRQLRPLQRDQRPGDQLGDPPALERARATGQVAEGPFVEALHQRDAGVGQQRPEQAADEVGVPVEEVGVHEHHQVAAGHEQRLPHRLALAPVGAELRTDLVRAMHSCAGVGRCREGVIGRVRVDDDDLVEQRGRLHQRLAHPGHDVAHCRRLVAGGDHQARAESRLLLVPEQVREVPVLPAVGAYAVRVRCHGPNVVGRAIRA